jgi:hypothetical protein
MRRSLLIGTVVAVGLVVLAREAPARWYYPRGYGGYGWGGWTGGATDPAAGYMAGLGAFARGQGVYELDDAKAQQINLQTMLKWNKELRARQQQLQAQKQQEAAQRVAARDARVARMELEDGTTLNNLLLQILDFDPAASRSSRADAPVGSSAVHAIPFEWNTEAITLCLDELLARDALPDVLEGPEFASDRTAVGQAVAAALKEDARSDVSAQTMRRLSSAISAFHTRFQARVPKDDPDYADSEAYFATLASLTRLLHDPSMKKVLAELESEQETTVGKLLGFMQTYNLRFGPATTARQVQVYKNLAGLLQTVRNDLGAAPNAGAGAAAAAAPAPPPPDPALRGKNLPGAAKDAFGKMGWPQLEAHARQP